MNSLNIRRLLLTAVMSVFMSACSGGSGGTGASPAVDASSGTVTKLGSVFVNGVEFETSPATVITLDGVTAAEAQVEGMAVEISGSINGDVGVAGTVKAETSIKGPVDSVINDTAMVVMGQTVRLDDNVIMPNITSLTAQLIAGDLVEVSGLIKPGGIVIASFVEEKTSLVEYKVKGYINTGSVTANTFDIGTLTINFSSADLSDLPGGPADDVLVEVKANNAPSGGILTATKVEAEGLDVVNAPEVEVEGYVTDLSGADPNLIFFVAGQEVHTSVSTTFEIGDASYLINGVKVEVEGQLSSGILQATEVSLRDSVRIEGDITGLSGNSFQIKGLPGITVSVIASTEFNSSSDTFTDFANDTHMRLRGFPNGTTSILITRLDERSANTDAILRGPVNNFNELGQTVEILGTTISTAGLTFQNENDVNISEAQFFAALQQGRQVKFKGTWSGTAISWTDAELED